MKKKTIFLLIIFLLLAVAGYFIFNPFKQKDLKSPISLNQKSAEITVSKTLKNYADPSGFSFNYPDNLSILNNELKPDSSYAELQLTASSISGSLVLKIEDTKLKSLDAWAKASTATSSAAPKEVMLGTLKAQEVEKDGKLTLGALDQGILFTIEIPISENKEFWTETLNIVIADFSFAQPQAQEASQDTTSSASDVSFDGEEVVE